MDRNQSEEEYSSAQIVFRRALERTVITVIVKIFLMRRFCKDISILLVCRFRHSLYVLWFASSKFYDERDDFDFDIVNFPFLDVDVPRHASCGVYISQLIRFARVCNHVADFNARNKCLTAKLLQQGYWYHKLRKTVSKFYRRLNELISKFNVGLKPLYVTAFRKHKFMMTWFTNLRNL